MECLFCTSQIIHPQFRANCLRWRLSAVDCLTAIYTVRPRKKETHKSSYFFPKTVTIYQKKVYIVTKLSLPSFFWHQLQDVFAMHGHSTNHFKWWCQNWFAQNMNLRAYRDLPRFRTKGRVEKTFISISFVSFVMFLLLRLLILTWIN